MITLRLAASNSPRYSVSSRSTSSFMNEMWFEPPATAIDECQIWYRSGGVEPLEVQPRMTAS